MFDKAVDVTKPLPQLADIPLSAFEVHIRAGVAPNLEKYLKTVEQSRIDAARLKVGAWYLFLALGIASVVALVACKPYLDTAASEAGNDIVEMILNIAGAVGLNAFVNEYFMTITVTSLLGEILLLLSNPIMLAAAGAFLFLAIAAGYPLFSVSSQNETPHTVPATIRTPLNAIPGMSYFVWASYAGLLYPSVQDFPSQIADVFYGLKRFWDDAANAMKPLVVFTGFSLVSFLLSLLMGSSTISMLWASAEPPNDDMPRFLFQPVSTLLMAVSGMLPPAALLSLVVLPSMSLYYLITKKNPGTALLKLSYPLNIISGKLANFIISPLIGLRNLYFKAGQAYSPLDVSILKYHHQSSLANAVENFWGRAQTDADRNNGEFAYLANPLDKDRTLLELGVIAIKNAVTLQNLIKLIQSPLWLTTTVSAKIFSGLVYIAKIHAHYLAEITAWLSLITQEDALLQFTHFSELMGKISEAVKQEFPEQDSPIENLHNTLGALGQQTSMAMHYGATWAWVWFEKALQTLGIIGQEASALGYYFETINATLHVIKGLTKYIDDWMHSETLTKFNEENNIVLAYIVGTIFYLPFADLLGPMVTAQVFTWAMQKSWFAGRGFLKGYYDTYQAIHPEDSWRTTAGNFMTPRMAKEFYDFIKKPKEEAYWGNFLPWKGVPYYAQERSGITKYPIASFYYGLHFYELIQDTSKVLMKSVAHMLRFPMYIQQNPIVLSLTCAVFGYLSYYSSKSSLFLNDKTLGVIGRSLPLTADTIFFPMVFNFYPVPMVVGAVMTVSILWVSFLSLDNTHKKNQQRRDRFGQQLLSTTQKMDDESFLSVLYDIATMDEKARPNDDEAGEELPEITKQQTEKAIQEFFPGAQKPSDIDARFAKYDARTGDEAEPLNPTPDLPFTRMVKGIHEDYLKNTGHDAHWTYTPSRYGMFPTVVGNVAKLGAKGVACTALAVAKAAESTAVIADHTLRSSHTRV